jgi:hypothetical protein
MSCGQCELVLGGMVIVGMMVVVILSFQVCVVKIVPYVVDRVCLVVLRNVGGLTNNSITELLNSFALLEVATNTDQLIVVTETNFRFTNA